MSSDHDAASPWLMLRDKVSLVASFGGTVAATVLAGASFFPEVTATHWRWLVLGIAAVVAIIGIIAVAKRSQSLQQSRDRAGELQIMVDRLELQISGLEPGNVLETLGTVSFVRPGGWRLTLFILEQLTDKSWHLKPLLARASSEVFEHAAHETFPLANSLLGEVINKYTGDPFNIFTNETGNLPDPGKERDEWARLRYKVIPLQGSGGMPTIKFSWTAVREPVSRRTLVLLSESTQRDGIRMDVVRSELLAPTVALVGRMMQVSPTPSS